MHAYQPPPNQANSVKLLISSGAAQVGEAETADILERKLHVEPGALLYIQSRVPLRKLPTLCSRYRCFNRDAVWVDRNPEVRCLIWHTPAGILHCGQGFVLVCTLTQACMHACHLGLGSTHVWLRWVMHGQPT